MYTYKAYVTKVYDGDTITADIDLGMGVTLKKQKIRLLGINTPELRGNDKENAIKARDFLRELILHKKVTIVTHMDDKGKWGRWLGDVYIPKKDGPDICVNTILINKGLADPYEK